MGCSVASLYAWRKAWLKGHPKRQALIDLLLCGGMDMDEANVFSDAILDLMFDTQAKAVAG